VIAPALAFDGAVARRVGRSAGTSQPGVWIENLVAQADVHCGRQNSPLSGAKRRCVVSLQIEFSATTVGETATLSPPRVRFWCPVACLVADAIIVRSVTP
jgi:hypothetical protein